MRALRALWVGVRPVSVLCVAGLIGFAGPAATAADIAVKAPAPRITSDWLPMFGDLIEGAIPVLRGASKITENESPRPTDRVFFTYNYYDNVNGGGINVHRETLGFEKTFLDGNASIGVRMPFIQFSEPFGTQAEKNMGDISVIFKYAFVNTPTTVVSTGLVLTLPTGSLVTAFDLTTGRDVHPAVFQPFVGAAHNFTRDFFVQGFSSVAVPTDDRDVTMLYNSFGAGYWVYRAPSPRDFISGVVPMLEVHVNTPLNNQDLGFPNRLETMVNLTGGVRIQLFGQASLGIGVGVPIAGPRTFDVEGIAQLNFRF